MIFALAFVLALGIPLAIAIFLAKRKKKTNAQTEDKKTEQAKKPEPAKKARKPISWKKIFKFLIFLFLVFLTARYFGLLNAWLPPELKKTETVKKEKPEIPQPPRPPQPQQPQQEKWTFYATTPGKPPVSMEVTVTRGNRLYASGNFSYRYVTPNGRQQTWNGRITLDGTRIAENIYEGLWKEFPPPTDKIGRPFGNFHIEFQNNSMASGWLEDARGVRWNLALYR